MSQTSKKPEILKGVEPKQFMKIYFSIAEFLTLNNERVPKHWKFKLSPFKTDMDPKGEDRDFYMLELDQVGFDHLVEIGNYIVDNHFN